MGVFLAVARHFEWIPPFSVFLERLREIPKGSILIAMALMTVQVWIQSFRFFLVLDRSTVRVRWRDAMEALVSGQAANLILPARIGDVVRVARICKRTKMSVIDAAIALGMDKLQDTLSLIPWLGFTIGLSFLLPKEASAAPVSDLHRAGWWIGMSTLFLFLVIPRTRALFLRGFGHAAQTLGKLLARPRAMGGAYVLSLLAWSCEFAAVGTILRGLQVDAPLAGAARAILGANVGLSIPLAPAGLGAFETGVVSALHLGGMPSDAAWGVAVAYHLAQMTGVVISAIFFHLGNVFLTRNIDTLGSH